jgi:hypothetical protein
MGFVRKKKSSQAAADENELSFNREGIEQPESNPETVQPAACIPGNGNQPAAPEGAFRKVFKKK